jgi:hypothetical protein
VTEDELNELATLAKNATTGPWKVECGDHAGDDWLIASLGYTDEEPAGNRQVTTDRVRASQYFGDADGDAKFIVAARRYVPALVLEIRRLRTLLGEAVTYVPSNFRDLRSNILDALEVEEVE